MKKALARLGTLKKEKTSESGRMNGMFTGLCMAWGNFCFIPGIKKWDENARSIMLGWLPTIGLVIGCIWAAAYFGVLYVGMPYLLVTFVMTFLPFLMSGFIHVDGFMDCNDAMLSRGDLAKKQNILKDSRCGTFAVITMLFTVLCFYSSMGCAISYGIDFVNLIAITVISRSVSGLEVLISKPMATSQYASMAAEYEEDDAIKESESDRTVEDSYASSGFFDGFEDFNFSNYRGGSGNNRLASAFDEEFIMENHAAVNRKNTEDISEHTEVVTVSDPEETDTPENSKPATVKQGAYLLAVQLIILLALVAIFCKYYLVTALVVLGTALGTFISCSIAKKSLGGMNGDIAGYSIVWGEMIGLIVLALA